jgi:hypothetical protein
MEGKDLTMKNLLKRDITGECVGECKNTVRDAEQRRQAEINDSGVASPDAYPQAAGASSRNEPPGFWGGHV